MATTARQQYFADESSLSKEKREFSIADEIQEKIDSVEEGAQVNKIEAIKVNGTALVPDAYKAVDIDVPEVIDNLYTVDSDNALSAKQGKLLYDYIQNIASRGRFLSNWNSATGLPMTNPSESPYPYKSGDYFVVSNVATSGGTNYRPDGSSYVIGQASTVIETEDVSVSDFYFYDGTNWLLLSNSDRSLAVDTSLSTTSTNPVENRVITNAINLKANDADVVHIAGAETITGEKTFNSKVTYNNQQNYQAHNQGPTSGYAYGVYQRGDNMQYTLRNAATDSYINTVFELTPSQMSIYRTLNVPSKTTDAADTGTLVATEAQVYKKQDKLTAGTNIQIDSSTNTISATDTKYTAGTGINIDANNVISNTQTSAEWGNITGTLSDQTDLQTALDAKQDNMVILKYGTSTWNDFITAYNKNGVIYCRASSNSNPASGSQTRLAFMAYVNNETTPTEVEFQYYRSRSDHNTQTNQLDEVYVYKLESNGTWSVTTRNTGAKAVAGTGISLGWGSGNMTISADTSVLATKTYVDEHDTVVSSTAPSSPTEGMLWYNTTNDVLNVYDGTQWNAIDTNTTYTAGNGINITNNEISADTTVLATKTDLNSKQDTISDLATIRSGAALGATALQPGDNVSELTNDSGYITSSYHDSSKQDVLTAGANVQISAENVISATDTTYTAMSQSEAASGTTITPHTISAGILKGAIRIHSKVQSVNGNEGAVTVSEFNPGGTATTGYVVTKTANGYEWAAPSGGIEVDENSPIQLTKIRAGTQAQYEALSSYDSTTVYLTI